MKINRILAIDTSCDETAVAVTDKNRVLANYISTQIEAHREFGGVVPMLAKRMHRERLPLLIKLALKRFSKIEAVAVTVGPGLAPALEVGVAAAKELAQKQNLPLIAINHMEGHLLSPWARNRNNRGSGVKDLFPTLGLLVSGGHTQLVLMKGFGDYRLLGETVDDAAGEAFDKVAKMLNLGYPGGPVISELAKKGRSIYDLPIPMAHSQDLNFSFSGLKTACLYKIRKINRKDKNFYCNFAASFEKSVVQALAIKLEKAILLIKPRQLVLGGGVINNLRLRKEARRVARRFNLPIFTPYTEKTFTDNAAMIGVCAWYQAQRNGLVNDINGLDRLPNLNFYA
ncbi:MAG: tRNA (adenosine(37)-N6)-threonylcarbamoyltransferase complex transferase subunit TsaD [Candidatus Shapirobacteria bacterium]